MNLSPDQMRVLADKSRSAAALEPLENARLKHTKAAATWDAMAIEAQSLRDSRAARGGAATS